MTEPMTDERLAIARSSRDFRRRRLAEGKSVTPERVLFCEVVDEIDRLRAELAAKEAECERLLRENLELKMQPVFDEYRP